MYSPQLWQHFLSPRNRGRLEPCDSQGESTYPLCGDWLRLTLRCDQETIQEICFEARGCGAVVAAASAGTTLVMGQSRQRALALDSFELDQVLGGLPASKRHAYWMFLECLRGALGKETVHGTS